MRQACEGGRGEGTRCVFKSCFQELNTHSPPKFDLVKKVRVHSTWLHVWITLGGREGCGGKERGGGG